MPGLGQKKWLSRPGMCFMQLTKNSTKNQKANPEETPFFMIYFFEILIK
jgi:hypothetical protein